MIPFEELNSSMTMLSLLSKADEILLNGWRYRGCEAIDLNRPISWQLKNQEQRSHNYHTHSLGVFDILLRAHSHSQDAKYLVVSLRVALDWIRQNSDPQAVGISPFAWYDMAVGLRAYRLAYLFQAADQAGLLDEDAHEAIWSSLEQHAAYLADDANIAFHNNHGYYQVVGQLALGRRFSSLSSLMAQAQKQGRERLQRILRQQFSPDGVHQEHSPGYHHMVYCTLKALIDSGLVENEETIVFARRIEEALSWFVLPNQHIVNFGDSDDIAFARSPREAEDKWVTSGMRFWGSGGKLGELSGGVVRVFPNDGYWIARKAGENARNPAVYSYLALNAAFHSRTHKHADDLSFVWSDRGANILVDAGRYDYIGKTEQGSELWLDGHWYSDPWRVYCESTKAHNALEFDGRNSPRKGVDPYGSALGRWGEDDSGLVYVEAECKYFDSIRHARMLFFMPGQWLLVFDWFNDNANAQHTVRQWFHIGHKLQLTLDQEQYLLAVPGSPEILRIVSLLGSSLPSRPYIGEEYPVIQGWWSGKALDVVPNYAFCHELSGKSSGAYATLFSFSNQLQADTEWSKVDASGRKGQFRWEDQSGVHELRFERPVEGDLAVKYVLRARVRAA
jgi:hypothetical protein